MGSIVTGFPTLFFASQELMVIALAQGVLDSATQQAVQSVLKNQTDLADITANMAPKEWQRFAAQSIAARLHPRRSSTFVYAGFEGFQILSGQGNGDNTLGGDMVSERKNVTAYLNEGIVLQREGKRVEARNAYRRIFYADPEATQKEIHVLACLNMGSLYLEENNFADAAYILMHAITLNPDRIDARSNYAVALLGLNRSRMAMHQLSIVLDKASAIREAVSKSGKGVEDLPMDLKQLYSRLDEIEKNSVKTLRQIEATMEQKTEREGPKEFGPKDLKGLSKSVSYALRHAPWEFALELDGEGWVNIGELLFALHLNPIWKHVTRGVLERMVRDQSQGRYEINGDDIRALYGHSIPGRLSKEPVQPPDILYHGTDERYLPPILANGLEPSGRQYLHLFLTREKALERARAKGKNPVVLTIHAVDSFKEGYLFYMGTEQVWLADFIPPKFFKIQEDKK